MMVVEFLGSPGAGKTTLVPAVTEELREQRWEPWTVIDAARPFAARSLPGRASARFVPASLRDAWLWRVFAVLSALHGIAFFLRNPNLARQAFWRQRFRPAAADVRRRRVGGWFFRMAGRYAFLSAHALPGEVLILDEGFAHRVVQLFASTVELPSRRVLADYVSRIPRPEVVVHVRTPAVVCEERIHARGVWDRLQNTAELEAFVRNAHETVEMTASQIKHEGWAVIEVDNGGPDAAAAVAAARRGVATVFGSRAEAAIGAGNTTIAGAVFPKPGRVRDAAASRVRPPAIDAGTAARVLDMYGIEMTRRPRNVPTGWRNRIVVLRTSSGKKVLKQYRPDRELPSVLWEHSIIAHLEKIGFPAVRLAATPSGATFVEEDGERFALFDFIEGRNLAGLAMGSRMHSDLIRVAGQTLAGFHRSVVGFQPDGAHTLGYRTYTSARIRDVEWHLSRLDELVRLSPSLSSPEARSRAEWLSSRAPAIGARLSELARVLEGADLPRTVIHGDFGVHNLLLRSNWTAVVHDFELARIEWRAIDVIIVLSRLSEDHGRAFLAAYRTALDLTPEELHHLGEVWQYYRLRGAVQSWNSFVQMGGGRRLETARRRVEEADALAGRRVAR